MERHKNTTHASGEPAVRISGVTFAFNGDPVLRNMSIDIKEREFVAIVGPNGSGKTTILKLILGLLHPLAGSVRVFGSPPERARARMGYVPQYIYADVRFPVHVLDVALMGRLGRRGAGLGPYSARDRRAALDALDEVGLSDLRNRPFSDLSGGQRQRVLIARALVSEPDILLLDEPTASLDSEVAAQLYDLLGRMNERMTVILVSHDLWFVSRYVKRVLCIQKNVQVHDTTDVDAEALGQLCGLGMRMVRHQDSCPGGDCR
jgi:zinc transport system ATP-binding protein